MVITPAGCASGIGARRHGRTLRDRRKADVSRPENFRRTSEERQRGREAKSRSGSIGEGVIPGEPGTPPAIRADIPTRGRESRGGARAGRALDQEDRAGGMGPIGMGDVFRRCGGLGARGRAQFAPELDPIRGRGGRRHRYHGGTGARSPRARRSVPGLSRETGVRIHPAGDRCENTELIHRAGQIDTLDPGMVAARPGLRRRKRSQRGEHQPCHGRGA
jgi:hypothetical protein